MEIYKRIGDLIAFHRKKKGLTQAELGNRLNLTRVSITNIEKGRQRISLHKLLLLSKLLDVSIDTLTQNIDLDKLIPKDVEFTLKHHYPISWERIKEKIIAIELERKYKE